MPVDDPTVAPHSRAQREAWDAGQLPEPELVAPDVWAVGIPIPAGTIPHTLSYLLVGDDGVHVIDPGWDHPASTAAFDHALGALGLRVQDVRTVIATHFHPDHMGALPRLQRLACARAAFSATEALILQQETSASAAGAGTYLTTLEAWGVPPAERADLARSFERSVVVASATPDVAVEDGQVLALSGHRLRAFVAPGHTGGHLCLVDEERSLVYAGDNVLPRIYPGVGIGVLPGGDPLGDYFDALERLAPYDQFAVLPGHEYAFTGLAARRAQIIRHHLRRTAEVAGLAQELGDASVWEYARRLTWSAGWEAMTGLWLHSALLQTSLHREYVASGRADVRLEHFRAGR